MGNKSKGIIMAVILVIAAIASVITFNLVTENVRAGHVGYRYDRTVKNGAPNTIVGTSVLDAPLTGLVVLNPFTQEILKYPTTIVAKNWTRLEEGDNKTDMSMQVGSREGKNVEADVYVSVRPKDMGKIISSFGLKSFNAIIDDDVYGLVKGKLSIVAQTYSVYDLQSKRSTIQEETFKLLSETLEDIYGIELVRFEIGTLVLPVDIQNKIDQKTEAANAVELARLDREKQDQINQKVVDEQKAVSEKERLRRQSEADASAYEKETAAQAALAVAESNVLIAEKKVEEAKLMAQAALEEQKGFSADYFRNKELDVQAAAVKAINPTVKTIITDGSGSSYSGLIGLQEILKSIKD